MLGFGVWDFSFRVQDLGLGQQSRAVWLVVRHTRNSGLGFIIPLKQIFWFRVFIPPKEIEYGEDGDLILIYKKPDSIFLRGTINP